MAFDPESRLVVSLVVGKRAEDATHALAKSTAARAILGEPFVDHYVRTRDWEVRQYERAVTDWELARYFEAI